MSEKVTLIVKAANQGSLDHKIDCSLDWDINYVKEEIMKTHPAKPTVQEQRLIYSGQLLQDSLKLRTILRHPTDNNEYTIHLVYSPKYSSSLREPQDQPPLHISPPGASLLLNGNVPHANVAPDSNLDGIRHRLGMNNSVPSSSLPERDFDPNIQVPQLAFPFQASDALQHMAAMQHIYSQYMTSYLQYMQSEEPGNIRMSQEAVPPLGSSVPPEIQTQAINDRVPPQDPNAGNNQDVDRDAQVRAIGGDEEDDGIARDWLDYLYFGSRLVVLLSIVYFYSTLGRFMLVACTTVLIYMYQCGWFRFWRMEEQPAQHNGNEGEANAAPQPVHEERVRQNNDPPQDQDHPSENVSEEARNENRERGDRTENETTDASQANPRNDSEQTAQNRTMEDLPPQPTLLSLSWTFLTTFFTSLIPEQHEIV